MALIIFVAAAAGFALLGCAGEAPGTTTIQGADLAKRLGNDDAPLILDVRSQWEFRTGHIPGAVFIPHKELAGRIAELEADPDDEIVVYCESGYRARVAERTLVKAGYTNVRDLEGHMRAWRKNGYPVE